MKRTLEKLEKLANLDPLTAGDHNVAHMKEHKKFFQKNPKHFWWQDHMSHERELKRPKWPILQHILPLETRETWIFTSILASFESLYRFLRLL